ncbi:hypothetical protein [Flavisolibacter nicotianae]|uniref:hypothetical protein n=1 Tax=Flavisolibacter nicotianae TaxID=2364882 RepID=UPI000EB5D068|nr:hypothetical protein [Flavisolibacter nicotianae]
MKQAKKFLPALSFLLLLHAAHAQSDTAQAKPQFKLSVNYNTRLNYYGRTDSLKSSGIFPLAELWFTPKFYVNAAPIFVNNSMQHFDYAGTVATIGYQNVGTKWISGVYVTKPFYKESSALVQSALKAQSGVSLAYQTTIVNINAGGDVKFSDKVDYGATAGLDHIIRIENSDKSVIVLDPAVYAYAGTQNFQRTYYKKNNSGFLLFPGNNQQVTEEVSRFNVLAYEATMPLIYAKGKVMLIATPAYIIPQNLVTVANRPDLSERGQNTFYATLTAKYTF